MKRTILFFTLLLTICTLGGYSNVKSYLKNAEKAADYTGAMEYCASLPRNKRSEAYIELGMGAYLNGIKGYTFFKITHFNVAFEALKYSGSKPNMKTFADGVYTSTIEEIATGRYTTLGLSDNGIIMMLNLAYNAYRAANDKAGEKKVSVLLGDTNLEIGLTAEDMKTKQYYFKDALTSYRRAGKVATDAVRKIAQNILSMPITSLDKTFNLIREYSRENTIPEKEQYKILGEVCMTLAEKAKVNFEKTRQSYEIKKYYTQGISYFRLSGDTEKLKSAKTKAADSYLKIADFYKHIPIKMTFYGYALPLLSDLGRDSEAKPIYIKVAEYKVTIKDYVTAIEYFNKGGQPEKAKPYSSLAADETFALAKKASTYQFDKKMKLYNTTLSLYTDMGNNAKLIEVGDSALTMVDSQYRKPKFVSNIYSLAEKAYTAGKLSKEETYTKLAKSMETLWNKHYRSLYLLDFAASSYINSGLSKKETYTRLGMQCINVSTNTGNYSWAAHIKQAEEYFTKGDVSSSVSGIALGDAHSHRWKKSDDFKAIIKGTKAAGTSKIVEDALVLVSNYYMSAGKTGLIRMGDLYAWAENYEKAGSFYDKAGYKEGYATIANMYTAKGDFDNAIGYYKKAGKSKKDMYVDAAQNTIAEARSQYTTKKDELYKKAAGFYKKAGKKGKAKELLTELAEYYLNLAVNSSYLYQEENMKKAEEALLNAMSKRKTYTKIGDAFMLATGNQFPLKATAYYKKAKLSEKEINRRLGDAYLAKNNFYMAEQHYDKAKYKKGVEKIKINKIKSNFKNKYYSLAISALNDKAISSSGRKEFKDDLIAYVEDFSTNNDTKYNYVYDAIEILNKISSRWYKDASKDIRDAYKQIKSIQKDLKTLDRQREKAYKSNKYLKYSLDIRRLAGESMHALGGGDYRTSRRITKEMEKINQKVKRLPRSVIKKSIKIEAAFAKKQKKAGEKMEKKFAKIKNEKWRGYVKYIVGNKR